MSGFQFPVSFRTIVSGAITVVDTNGRPVPHATVIGNVGFRGYKETSSTGLQPDGTFRFSLGDGDHTIDIDRLPPQFTIQSIADGSTDLMSQPLKVDHNSPSQIQARVVMHP